MKNPFNQIATFEDYVEIIGVPKEQLQNEEVKNRINKWLVQATEQFDSMISGNGKLGRLYRWYEALQNNDEDNYKKYKLIKAICSWVETFVIKGKFWVDGLPVINSNVDIQINSSSNDSNVEMKRKDIIQDLVSVGLYQTTNFGDNTYQDNQQNANQLIEDLVVLSQNELQKNYLMINPQKPLQGNLDFANNDIVNGGNIIGSTNQANNNIQYYNIIDSTIDLKKNTIIGSIPVDSSVLNEIQQIQQEQQQQNSDILANTNKITTLENNVGTFDNRIETNKNEIARVDRVVNTNSTNIVNLDNKVNTNTNNINTNTTNITAVDSRLTNVSSLLNQTIDGLKTLKPFEYVGEYQQGSSYRINQAVSLSNNLYLSKEDNNTTTPPSNKWLLLNEDFASIDLTQYYTKLQVDSLINNVDNKVNTNTQKIQSIETNYWNKNDTNDADVKAGRVFLKQLFVGFTYNPNISSPYMLDAPGNNYLGDLEVDSINITTSSNTIDPTTPNSIANKHYVDTQNNNNVHLSGDQTINGTKTFNGTVRIERSGTLQNDGTTNLRIANINEASIVNGTLMNVGTASNSLVNKSYVDNAVANSGSGGNVPADLLNRVQDLENNTLKTTGNQNKSGKLTFISTGTPLELKSNSDTATFIAGYQSSNRRLWFLGKGSSNDDNVVFGTDRGNIMLQPANVIHCNNKKITNVADPQANNDVATKQYVDNAIQNIPSGGGGQAPNVGWIQLVNLNNLAANNNWRTFGTQSLNNNTLPNNFWENDRYYELQITVRKGDFSRKWFSRFQKLNGENWILSNNIKVYDDLQVGGNGELYCIIGTANSGTNWRELRFYGINSFQIDNINVKIRKLDNSTSGQTYDTNVYNGNWANMNNPNINLNNINLDFSKPITITIWRSNNANDDLGYQSHTILLPTVSSQVVAVSSDMYYRQNTDTIEQAAKTGIMIKNKVITRVQCWDANDRVKQITIGGWRT